MKLIILFTTVIALSACKDDHPTTNGIRDLTDNRNRTWTLVCLDNIKYITSMGGGITAKIDSKTKQPELCTE
jgi:hypothetical protein